MASDSPSIGIICQALVQQHHLRQVVEQSGFLLEKNLLVSSILSKLSILETCSHVDIWLVDVDMDSLTPEEGFEHFEEWLYSLDTPIIFGEGKTRNAVDGGLQSWSRQLRQKLIDTSAQLINEEDISLQRADSIWVLAASAGGPEAVKEFLDHLPGGLGISFLYVQHIEQRQHQPLMESITRDCSYNGRIATHGDLIHADTVTLVPVLDKVTVLSSGIVVSDGQETWRGIYKPSIDQVVANIANIAGAMSGVIFFSGMGDDGVAGARLMARSGGQVWVQTFESCQADSMPKAIFQTGVVSVKGKPRQLAAQLARAYGYKQKPKLRASQEMASY